MLNIETRLNTYYPQAFIRFMLYTDVNRRRATKVGDDNGVDLKTVFGSMYDYGTRHDLVFTELDSEPGQYVVAMVPYIRQIPHPEKEGDFIPLRLVYLTSVALWPFFEPLVGEKLDMAMLPE